MTIIGGENSADVFTSKNVDLLYITRDCTRARNLDFAIEHTEDSQKFWVLDDGERVVSTCDPHDKMVPQSCWTICRAMGKSSDALVILGDAGGASRDMATEIAGRGISPTANYSHRWTAGT